MGWFSKVGTFIKNNAHTILDVAGMIPGVGAVADIANAALYAAEGDWANAAMSAVSAVPGIGDTIAMANKGIKAAKGVNKALKAGKSLKSILKAGGKSGLKAMKGKVKAGAKAVKNWKETLGSIFKKKKTGEKHICTNGKCFTGDTLVCTNKGKVPIQEIRAGDLVYSRNEHTNEMGFRKVEEVFKTETHTLHSIEVNGETIIQTTAYHGFFVEEKGWVSAINLQKGDHLATPDGIAEVTGTRKERFEEPLTMYNLHVEEWVSYFVSGLNLYVHNGNGHKGNGKSSRRIAAEKKLSDAASGTNNRTIDPLTGEEVGRFIGDDHGNIMIEPVGGNTVPAGRGGGDTHTLYPNGSNYQRYNPAGHNNNSTPHGHGHLPGTGAGRNGQGASIDIEGNVVPFNSSDAHWTIH